LIMHRLCTSHRVNFKMVVIQYLLSGLCLYASANAQAYDSSDRTEDAFSYVQPLNTTILGPYGHSPAVLPARKSIPAVGMRACWLIAP
jgi:hypothetical protein